MLQLQITSLLLFVHKFCCFSSSLHRMNKGKTSQRLSKLTHLTNPTKTIENSIKVKRKPKRKNDSKFQANEGMITPASQSPSSLCYDKWAILGPDFYQIDALDLAPRLLGKFLKKDDVVLQITEVEAYRPNDSACHARFGITSRTAPVFGPGGHTYVYLCYGLHTMLNIVADKEGVGAAVLIRSCAPVNVNAMNVGHPIFNDFLTNMGNYFMDLISGLETIQQRRGLKTEKPVLLTGPGKEALIAVCTKSQSTKFVHSFLQESFEKGPLVGQALGISTEWSNHPLFTLGGLELLDGPEPEKILVGPRVGIEYALPEHVTALWRFAMAGTQWISAPKNTLRAP